ncbi:hypothetical protein N9E79_01315 [bacterium]|nr:hypothetical protein [bacterium]
MGESLEKKVIEYVQKNYKRSYGSSVATLTISEVGNIIKVSKHKDGSPLMLSKSILNS